MDALRARQGRAYVGPWLPALAPSERIDDAPAVAARYSLRESATIAFLVALEALTDAQRAVLVLHDVFDFSPEETAAVLELSTDDATQHLHRARDALALYEATRIVIDPTQHEQALAAMMQAILARAPQALLALLHPAATLTQDSAGEVTAALDVIEGADRVTKLLLGLGETYKEGVAVEQLLANGAPALLVRLPDVGPGYAHQLVMRLELAADGKVTQVHTIVARDKLLGLQLARER